MTKTVRRALPACGVALWAIFAACGAQAQTVPQIPVSAIPDLVVPTNGINLGGTSFYDGFSTLKPGLTVLGYVRHNSLNEITGPDNHNSYVFDRPRIDVTTAIAQFSVVTPLTIGGNAVGFDTLVPLTSINARFGSNGRILRDNGTHLSDVTFGPFVQFKPVVRNGRPVASIRLAFDVIAPTGGFNRSRDLNQSSAYWTLNPYLAFTFLPTPGWEISGRAQYNYNFGTTKIPNAPQIPGFSFDRGKAGQLFFLNFDMSRSISKHVSVGGNGFVIQQVTKDEINGLKLPKSERQALYFGPGMHIDEMPVGIINLNVYLPVTTRNYATGPQFNIQIIKPF